MGCHGGEPPPPSSSFSTSGFSTPADARVIVLVHGDGEYTWHDSTGRRRRANIEAVKQAREMAATQDARGEVFLFHLRKGRRGLFRTHDGTWEHHRGGSRVSGGTYSRTQKDTAFEAEARILRAAEARRVRDTGAVQAPSTAAPTVRLAYFGHELPLEDEPGYFGLRPERPFSQARFARALEALGAASDTTPGAATARFETIVLSMCYGGNPELVAALRPRARRLVASPAYLHLSYLDARALGDAGNPSAADTVAARSFARLSRDVQTEVTVGVYDLERVRPPLAAFEEAAAARAAAVRRAAWRDCAQAPRFDSASAALGTRLFYRAPRFGAGRGQAARSAWQCAF